MDLNKIKYSSHILRTLENRSLFLPELAAAVSVDQKALQNSLNKLQKLGLIEKDRAGRWKTV